jgi:hypothetical protein
MDSVRRPGTQTHQLSIGLLTVLSSICYILHRPPTSGGTTPRIVLRSVAAPDRSLTSPRPWVYSESPLAFFPEDQTKSSVRTTGFCGNSPVKWPAKPAQSDGSHAPNPSQVSLRASLQAMDKNRRKASTTDNVGSPSHFSEDLTSSLRVCGTRRRLSSLHFQDSPVFSSRHR